MDSGRDSPQARQSIDVKPYTSKASCFDARSATCSHFTLVGSSGSLNKKDSSDANGCRLSAAEMRAETPARRRSELAESRTNSGRGDAPTKSAKMACELFFWSSLLVASSTIRLVPVPPVDDDSRIR